VERDKEEDDFVRIGLEENKEGETVGGARLTNETGCLLTIGIRWRRSRTSSDSKLLSIHKRFTGTRMIKTSQETDHLNASGPSGIALRAQRVSGPALIDDELTAAAEPDAEAPAPSPEAKPDMAAPSSSPPPPSRENENLAKYSHKIPTRDELVIARVIGLANPGSFR
jgi:hypothetical protein